MRPTLGPDTVGVVSESKTIVVMRHGKAEQIGATDFERRLTERGRADAAAAGRWMAAQGIAPQAALVSAAVRTQETWLAVAAGAEWDLVPEIDEGLYAAGTDSVLDRLREVPAAHTSAILIGHNPTMASVAAVLDDGEGDPEIGTGLILDFPTSALAVFSFSGAWADLAEVSARLVGYFVGRGESAE